ncbi:hypothetical protein AB1N83_003724 [Pleurotus pulmonarius]
MGEFGHWSASSCSKPRVLPPRLEYATSASVSLSQSWAGFSNMGEEAFIPGVIPIPLTPSLSTTDIAQLHGVSV